MADREERPGLTNSEMVYKYVVKPAFVLACVLGGVLLQPSSSEPTCTWPIIGLVAGVAILGVEQHINKG